MINTEVNQVVYQGDGTTTEFSYPFVIISKATDIHLTLVDTDGTETNITKDYYVDAAAKKVYYPGYAPGSNVAEADTPEKLQEGQKLVIYRKIPITQLSKLDSHWPFNVIEDGLDKLTIICQQFSSVFGRCLKVSEVHDGFDSTIPVEPNKAIEINSDGTGFALADAPSTVRAQCAVIRDEAKAYKDQAGVYSTSASGSATNAANSATAAAGSATSASTSLNQAKAYAGEAVSAATIAKKAADKVEVYDATKTYQLGDTVCTTSGASYRCIATSTGESPSTSSKWVLIASVLYQTFESDMYGNLMVRYPPSVSSNWDIDDNGDIMPYSSSVLASAEELEF